MNAYERQIMNRVEMACQRIAPLWPLKNVVAVNPYMGLSQESFWQAHNTLQRMTGKGLCMPRDYYHEQIARGQIEPIDLAEALHRLGSPWDVPTFEQLLAHDSTPSSKTFPLVTDVLSRIDGQDWSNFVVERMSRYCAAYFDGGQARWSMPWTDASLYRGWCEFSRFDKTTQTMGIRGMRQALVEWPKFAPDAIVRAVRDLNVPAEAMDEYLYAALLSIGGWAGWTRYLGWQGEMSGTHLDAMRDLLAIRLTWDALLYRVCASEALTAHWHQAITQMVQPTDHRDVGSRIDVVLQTAFEGGYQRKLAKSLVPGPKAANPSERPNVQAVFCIDVRSEVYRRALETVTPKIQTLGFAGFFGIRMEYLPFGADESEGHLPVFFHPAYRIGECLSHANPAEINTLMVRSRTRRGWFKVWETFKGSASSAFVFVEAAGVWSAVKLIGDSMGWTHPTPRSERMGLSARIRARLGPALNSGEGCTADELTGIPEPDRPSVAEFVLRSMSLVQDFGRIVLFVGHGSTTSNNPQATGLDCGACGGHSGEASARTAARLLNDPLTRDGLRSKGIRIPNDTLFMAGLHDTTTDEIRLFDMNDVPASHAVDVAHLRRWLATAGQITRLERAEFLGLGHVSEPKVHSAMRKRSRDWAQVRPEWALAGNAAFIAAPRGRTLGRDLAGRVFLHEYNWRVDPEFATLQLIMTAPLMVAHWINMQYYGSVVDPQRFGSGNKVLHNVVGGSIGVLEGNGGDLRAGLAWQSLHNGSEWIHEPMRLAVFIEAPQSAIEGVIAHHRKTKDLVDNAWIHLFQIEDDGRLNRRGPNQQWSQYDPASPGSHLFHPNTKIRETGTVESG